ncbi:MAG: HAD family hydrolase [Ferrimonas sp.]
MTISESAVWVFDLDDTLYLEKNYQHSGYLHIANHLKKTYKKDVYQIIKLASEQRKDVFHEICSALLLPNSVKQSLLWMYRLHIPQIELSSNVNDALSLIKTRSLAMAIITDGRSVTQRNKLHALGLSDVDCLISEEWGELKPGTLRFQEIERRYPDAKKYIYVGDNIKKDFVTPKNMNWITIGLRDSGNNIHSQNISLVTDDYLPHFWINSLSELQDYIC